MKMSERIAIIKQLAEAFDKKTWTAEYRAISFGDNPTPEQVIEEDFLGGYVIGPPEPGRGDLAAITTMYLSLLDPATVLRLIAKAYPEKDQ